tara:strand:- start:287 stop:448 length:162 start_codon:yes stop_codon:yes gene_type:complete
MMLPSAANSLTSERPGDCQLAHDTLVEYESCVIVIVMVIVLVVAKKGKKKGEG